jgi:hypothetical protein
MIPLLGKTLHMYSFELEFHRMVLVKNFDDREGPTSCQNLALEIFHLVTTGERNLKDWVKIGWLFLTQIESVIFIFLAPSPLVS